MNKLANKITSNFDHSIQENLIFHQTVIKIYFIKKFLVIGVVLEVKHIINCTNLKNWTNRPSKFVTYSTNQIGYKIINQFPQSEQSFSHNKQLIKYLEKNSGFNYWRLAGLNRGKKNSPRQREIFAPRRRNRNVLDNKTSSVLRRRLINGWDSRPRGMLPGIPPPPSLDITSGVITCWEAGALATPGAYARTFANKNPPYLLMVIKAKLTLAAPKTAPFELSMAFHTRVITDNPRSSTHRSLLTLR